MECCTHRLGAAARQGADALVDGSATSIEDIAGRERRSPRQVNMTIALAFLSPKRVTAAVEGRLPRGIGISSLRDLPPIRAEQHRKLGLAF
jgi:hypothetical protein